MFLCGRTYRVDGERMLCRFSLFNKRASPKKGDKLNMTFHAGFYRRFRNVCLDKLSQWDQHRYKTDMKLEDRTKAANIHEAKTTLSTLLLRLKNQVREFSSD